ncbi:unnamed protein product [Mesocestoides corti]|uniref:Dynein light chain n=1 Tax=Mesocestoides corti TaxID=53468 RepID=A0A0R3UGB0_MESCO|nr:unnamed protein product [Mesocestoides corti]
MARPQIEVLKDDMPQKIKDFIIDQVDDDLLECNSNTSQTVRLEPIVTRLSKALKDNFGGIWQIVILTGSYSAHSSYAPNRLLNFKLGRFVVLVWQSTTD